MKLSTSCSDNEEYPDLCFQAANNERIYRNFRRHPIYTSIVETVSEKSGKEYFQMALSQTPELKKHLNNFVTSEKVGSPYTFSYKHNFFSPKYFFSPTTLRYIKGLSDLLHFFKSLDGMRIVEIGGGYGGLCKIISDFCRIESYTLVDLEPALQLSKRFLNDFSINNVRYLNSEDLDCSTEYDLVISNYAFSEIGRNIQDLYMDKILQKSSRGYLLCNFKTHTWETNQMNENNFINGIKNVKNFQNNPILSQLDLCAGIELIVWSNA